MPASHHDLIVREFLDLLGQRAQEKYRGRIHQAFIDWYIDAEFGRVDWRFTDDASDGGIDAVVWIPEENPPVVLLQSKFTENIARSMLGQGVYRELQNVVDAFRWKGDELDKFMSTVRSDVRPIYRRAARLLEKVDHWAIEKKAFRLISTHRRRPGARVEGISSDALNHENEILRLYAQYRKGGTPRARSLDLHIEDKLQYKDPRRRVTSYLFNAQLSDFRKYLEHNDVARLVARNIRYNLGGKIGRTIRKTYEKVPMDFWYFHNGITIICDEMPESNGVATLVNPSVVNGAQTLYAISDSLKKNSPSLVTTRVIVRGTDGNQPAEDDVWLQGVIRGVNTQNRVKASDFWSNEPEQFELQHRFREMGVFYERKRGEWKEFRNEPRFRGFFTVTLPELGKILTITTSDSGDGVLIVKQGDEDVFAEKNYRRLFPSRSKIGRRFEKIYLAFCAYRLLYEYGYKNSDDYYRQRHAFWNCLWLLHRGITSVEKLHTRASVLSIHGAFDRFNGAGRSGQRARKLVRQLTKQVWASWRSARKIDPERWTANNFFKSKFGNRTILRKAFPHVLPGLKSLGRELIVRR